MINIEGTNSWGADAGDKIDLSAFGIDEDELPGLIREWGGQVRIDLTGHGGGTINITAISDVDELDGAGGSTTGDGADVLDGSYVYTGDLNGDGDFDDTVNGVDESNGVFIL